MLKGAIFDLDGTLLDSMFIWDTLAVEYLNSLGKQPSEDITEIESLINKNYGNKKQDFAMIKKVLKKLKIKNYQLYYSIDECLEEFKK